MSANNYKFCWQSVSFYSLKSSILYFLAVLGCYVKISDCFIGFDKLVSVFECSLVTDLSSAIFGVPIVFPLCGQ